MSCLVFVASNSLAAPAKVENPLNEINKELSENLVVSIVTNKSVFVYGETPLMFSVAIENNTSQEWEIVSCEEATWRIDKITDGTNDPNEFLTNGHFDPCGVPSTRLISPSTKKEVLTIVGTIDYGRNRQGIYAIKVIGIHIKNTKTNKELMISSPQAIFYIDEESKLEDRMF
mgnify:CR=1 FL=1